MFAPYSPTFDLVSVRHDWRSDYVIMIFVTKKLTLKITIATGTKYAHNDERFNFRAPKILNRLLDRVMELKLWETRSDVMRELVWRGAQAVLDEYKTRGVVEVSEVEFQTAFNEGDRNTKFVAEELPVHVRKINEHTNENRSHTVVKILTALLHQIRQIDEPSLIVDSMRYLYSRIVDQRTLVGLAEAIGIGPQTISEAGVVGGAADGRIPGGRQAPSSSFAPSRRSIGFRLEDFVDDPDSTVQ